MANAYSRCKSCSSLNIVELGAEVCFRIPGLKGLKVEPIFAFPRLAVCLDCGFLQSNLSAEDLQGIRESAKKAGEATA